MILECECKFRAKKVLKGGCIELGRGCTSLLGGSCILQGGDQAIK